MALVLTVTPMIITDRIFCDGFEGVACSNTVGSVTGWSGVLLPALQRASAVFVEAGR
jgi:hypothetical protein